jgi:hypothetical protein
MYYESPIGAGMDVELHSVGSSPPSLPEGLERILRGIAGRAPMGEDARRGSGQSLDKSPNLWRPKPLINNCLYNYSTGVETVDSLL